MAKKKTKNKVPEFKCCGMDDHKCGADCKCNENKVEVFVCPKCQSVEVGYKFGFGNLFGVVPRMKCRDCGFEGANFPKWIIDKDKLTHEHKPVDFSKQKKKNKKTKKVYTGTEIGERYCPHCEDKVKVTMKDGSVDTFICDNCQFEIKGRKKK